MRKEAVAALDLLPVDDARRAELMHWQAEGLLVQLDARQRNQEWSEAFAILDQLESLSGQVNNRLLNPEKLAQDRRTIRLQQALDLLQANNRKAALALAGEELANDAYQPPPEARSLFDSWRITTTISSQSTEIELLGEPSPERVQDAREALQQLVDQWQTSSIPDQKATVKEVQRSASSTPALRLHLSLSDVSQSNALAQLTPTDANWALLRTLLFQLDPTITRSTHTLWDQVDLSQSIDLRTAGDHWNAMAISLDQQAEQYEAQAAGTDRADTQAAVQAEIQAANYRNAAQQWRALAQKSWATITLRADTGTQSSTRSWVIDSTTPPQQLKVNAQFINPIRLLGSIITLLLALFILSGLLWWLL